jgi:UDP:flavonoid glycosyltransferase YjiC (YdhE family)
VGAIRRGRPISPAGLDPLLPGLERPVNVVLLAARSLRRRRADRVWRAARQARATVDGEVAEDDPIASVSFSARSLDDYPSSPQDAYAYVGASLYRPHGEVTAGGPRDSVLVSWGSTAAPSDAEVMARLLPALADLATTVRVVVLSSDPGVREQIGAASSAIVLLDRSPAPPYDEYRRARLVIGHGGYGTIIESLCFGVPVLTIPLMAADRLETTQRVLQAGAGLTLDRYTFDATDAAAAIARLLGEPSFAARAAAVGADLRDGTARAELLDLLRETLASTGSA